MHTETVEDYLRSIYELQHRENSTKSLCEKVSTHLLAKRLKVKPSSVTGMVKRLAEMDLIIYEPYRGVTLTETGRKIALQVLRSHRLVELYLVEMLDVPWDQVHEEADKWEHVLSQKLADRIDTILGHPTQDPHGAPIPKQDGTISQPDYISLLELEVGQSATVAEVNDRNPDLLRYLAQLSLHPGTQVTLVEVAPFEGPLTICIDEKTHIVGRKVAQKISLINKERKTL